jgi:transcription-repair coupling factor (superfamily II helicase)
LYRELKRFPVLELRRQSDAPVHLVTPVRPPPQLEGGSESSGLSVRLQQLLNGHTGPVLLCAETAGRREILQESLRETARVFDTWTDFTDSDSLFGLTVAPIDRGLHLDGAAPMLVTEAQLFGERVAQRRRRRHRSAVDPEAIFRDLNELSAGTPVVHLEHGIGRYLGLTHLEVEGSTAEFLTLEYAEGDKLYVPVSSLQLISRYAGSDPEHAPLHRLGSEQWEKAQRKGRNPATGENMPLAARRVVTFRCSGKLRDRVNGR